MFEKWQDTPNSSAQTVIPEAVASKPSAPVYPQEKAPHSYSHDPSTHRKIPIGDIDAYLKQFDQSPVVESSPRAAGITPEASDVEIPVDLQSVFALIGQLLGNHDSPQTVLSEEVQDAFQPSDGEALVFTAKPRLKTPKTIGRLSAKTSELLNNHSPRRKVAAVGGIAVIAAVAAFGTQTHHSPAEQKVVLLTAPAGLINQGAVIGSIDLKSQATVRIPVAGFTKPLQFMKDNKPVEPATTLNDKISLTLAPTLDKKGNPLPIATIKNGDTFEVDRSKISVNASFDNYLGLNVDCSKPATSTDRFCVDGSPVRLQAVGNLKADTAKQLNDMLTAQGPGFDTYYQGVKAKLAVADLAKIERGACGTDIYRLADKVISNILHQQSGTAKIHFTQNSHYPSISQDFAAKFTGLVANKAFSIEQGDNKNAIANSLQFTCQVIPTNSKGAKQ